MNTQNKVNYPEKARMMAHRESIKPAALQADVLTEAAIPVETNMMVTPQGVNKPVSFSELVTYTKKIDGYSSSANSEATPTVTSTDKSAFRNFRRSVRVSPNASSSVTPTSAKSSRQRDVDEQNRQNSNLFIRNLDADVDQADLDELFSEYGTILSSAVMRNIHTGESQGTGFVRMSTHEEARVAMEALHNRQVGSKCILIQWAKRHDGAPVGEARKKIMKLFVRNIPLDCSDEMLEKLFMPYGNVRQVTLHKDTAPVDDAAMERLIAFVIYTEEGAAERAATAVHNTKPFPSCNGIPIMIKLAEDQVRHDRPRVQRYSQPNSPQQHLSSQMQIQQQQQLLQQQFQQQRPVMDFGYAGVFSSSQPQHGSVRSTLPITTVTGAISMRSSQETSDDSGSRSSVPIPNPRSVALAAANVKRVSDAVRTGCMLKATHPTCSPCLSVDSTSAPVSPAVVPDERLLEGLRSSVKYRHNPYSMLCSVFVC